MKLPAAHREFFSQVPESVWGRLEHFCDLLAGHGRKAGLIGFDPSDIPEQLARSLLVSTLWTETDRVIDLGSGAGLPGLPLAIVGEPVTLVEPRQRAQAFLELAMRELGLDVEIIPTTAEDTGKGALREASGVVVARALARPSIALELCTPLCRPGGMIVLSASPDATAIRGEWLKQLGLGEPELVNAAGPGDIHQLFHIVQKVESVGDAFPRKQGQAQRKPLA